MVSVSNLTQMYMEMNERMNNSITYQSIASIRSLRILFEFSSF